VKILPRSLRGRTLLVTVAGIIACELVTFIVFGAYRHNLLAGRARDFVSSQIEMVRNALAIATPEQVAQELDRPRQRGPGMFRPRDPNGPPRLVGRARTPGEPGAGPPPPSDPAVDDSPDARPRNGAGPPRSFSRMRLFPELPPNATAKIPDDLALPQVVTSLRDEYGADALRFTDDPELAIWVHMPSNGWWLMLPFARYASPPVPWPILWVTLAAISLMGGIVGLYVYRLAQPLRTLADAAANFKVGQHPALPLSGPEEVRAVMAQFNAMAERLERDDAERRVMLAGLPHDLRAPLSRAKLRLEMMDDGESSPKQGLQRDLTEVERIADQFVAYLRGLDHDKSGFRAIQVHELVRERGLVWRESGHDITITRADPQTLDADADALVRAVDNLIGNAFAHGGSPVSIEGVADAGDATYRIVVRDHGPGIAPDQREEALQPFTRLDTARGASGHCGLGLAVSQSIARLHGGHIALDEAEGGGLAAAIVLPLRTDSNATDA
jgi:two-component system, OmpR family, osmolarity sensor histidine kinase EnvZ